MDNVVSLVGVTARNFPAFFETNTRSSNRRSFILQVLSPEMFPAVTVQISFSTLHTTATLHSDSCCVMDSVSTLVKLISGHGGCA